MTTKTKTKTKKETHGFQTEVKQLLQLMIHSLYSNTEIFLRELISNASDAADKLRFLSIANPEFLPAGQELKIEIIPDKEAKTLTIKDFGVGMSHDEVIENLGTIAKSGTKAFMESLTGDQSKDSKLIGQFGVGFYSAFMVADKVTVLTRRAGLAENQAVRWESTGEGEYTIETATKAEVGTEVILHLKKDAESFLDSWKLRNIITKYSNHLALPIYMPKAPEIDEKGKEKPSTGELEIVNKAKALWTQSKSELKDEDYQSFYKDISHDYQEPLAWSHNKVEGKTEYTSLLYIPQKAPFDLFDRERKSGLKLYIQRVFIMENADILPAYLRFVKGVIDSNDLPLNVSREILQSSPVVDKIKSATVKKVLDMLDKMAQKQPEDYAKFWTAFGQVMKEGVGEDFSNREQLSKLYRFATTHHDHAEPKIALADYVSRMKEGQKHIYYVTAESFTAAKNSPHLEIFRKKGIEVLLLTDRVDEWLVSNLTEFDGKSLQSVAKGDLKLDEIKTAETDKKEEAEQKAKAEKEFESVLKQAKEVLGDKVKQVRLTDRLTDSPACVVADEAAMSMHLQRLMMSAGQKMPTMAPILELNPEHAMVRTLQETQDDSMFADWIYLLFDQALLAEGGQLEDPAGFVKRMNKYLKK
jgi:molecular chaperone HtpG